MQSTPWRSLPVVATLAAALAVGTAALGSLAITRTAKAQQVSPGAAVTIEAFQFKPKALDAKTGARVAWINDDDVTHTVTSGDPEQRVELFNASLNGKGAGFEFVFAKAGIYRYFCIRHPHMRGEIIVK